MRTNRGGPGVQINDFQFFMPVPWDPADAVNRIDRVIAGTREFDGSVGPHFPSVLVSIDCTILKRHRESSFLSLFLYYRSKLVLFQSAKDGIYILR